MKKLAVSWLVGFFGVVVSQVPLSNTFSVNEDQVLQFALLDLGDSDEVFTVKILSLPEMES